MGSASWKTRLAALTLVTVVAATAVACSSTNSTTTTTASGGKASIGNRTVPSSAFSDHTGITATSIKVGNVSTLAIGGLFKGALVGTQAYADYVNSTGGVNGRKITVDSADDQYTGTGNKEATQNAVSTDAALVGGFSTFDSFGGTVLAQNPGVPDVTQVLDPATNALPNVYSAVPLEGGWEEGALQYYWKKFGSAPLQHVGTLVANLPSPEADWAGEKYVMEKVGYHVVYDATYGDTQFDFTPNVIAMRNAGVKVLFIDQMAEVYASALLKNLVQQNFHPLVVMGAATYSTALIPAAGGPGRGQRLLLRPERLALPRRGQGLDPRGVDLPPLGQRGLARVPRRPVHPLRVAVGAALRPGPEGRGLQPEPRVDPDRALEGHLVQRWEHRDHQQPGGKVDVQLLSGRPGAQLTVDPAGQPADQQPDPRVPVRLLLRGATEILSGVGGTGAV